MCIYACYRQKKWYYCKLKTDQIFFWNFKDGEEDEIKSYKEKKPKCQWKKKKNGKGKSKEQLITQTAEENVFFISKTSFK